MIDLHDAFTRAFRSGIALGLICVGAFGCRQRVAAAPGPEDPSGTKHRSAHHHHHAHAPGEMPHRFEDAEQWAQRFDDPTRDAWQRPDAVIDALALPADAQVAEIGAGTGYFAMRIAAAVPHGKVYANDLEPDMVRYLGERARREGVSNVEAVQGTATDARLPEPVDVVFLCNVIHHMQDRPAFFAALRTSIAPAGRVVIVDFEPDAPEGTPGPPAEHRLAAAAVEAELATVGYRRARVDHDLLPYQYVLVFSLDPAQAGR